MSFTLPAINLQNVVPGNTAILTLPVGKNAPTLDKLQLALGGGLTAAHITSIVGKVGAKVIFEETAGAAQLKSRDLYRGLFVENGFVDIDFTEPKARNGAVEQLLASIPMSLLQKLQFEFKISATAPVGITMDALMHLRRPTSNPYILKRLRTSEHFGNDGMHAMFLPTGNSGGKFKRIWIHEGAAGSIREVEIRVGNTVVNQITRAALEHSQKVNGLAPQAGIVCIDFIEDGNLSGVLDTGDSSDVNVRIDGAPDTYDVVYDFIDPINRL